MPTDGHVEPESILVPKEVLEVMKSLIEKGLNPVIQYTPDGTIALERAFKDMKKTFSKLDSIMPGILNLQNPQYLIDYCNCIAKSDPH